MLIPTKVMEGLTLGLSGDADRGDADRLAEQLDKHGLVVVVRRLEVVDLLCAGQVVAPVDVKALARVSPCGKAGCNRCRMVGYGGRSSAVWLW